MARRVRIFLILTLTVALLPWGAWIKAANASQVLRQAAIESVALAAPKARTAIPPCRTATLPGKTCPADPALLPSREPEPDSATSRALRTADVVTRSLHTPSGPDRPPRLV